MFENVLLITYSCRQLLRESPRLIDVVVGYYKEATMLYSYDGCYAIFVDLTTQSPFASKKLKY